MVWVIGFAELGPDRHITLLRKVNSNRSSVAFSSPDNSVIGPNSLY